MTAGGSEFTTEEVARATRIGREGGWLLVAVMVVAALAWTWLLEWLNRWHADHAATVPWWQQLVLYVLVVVGLIETVRIAWPVAWTAGIGRRHQLGRRLSRSLLRGLLVTAALRLAATLLTVAVIWWLARRWEWGWLAVGPVLALVGLGLSAATMRQLRWMYRLRPLEDARCLALLDQLMGDRPRIPAWVLPGSELGPQINGAVGLDGLRGQALVVWDTALALPDDQLRVLLAHELGHVEMRHAGRRRSVAVALSVVAGGAALALTPSNVLLGAERAAWNEGQYITTPTGTAGPPGRTFVEVTGADQYVRQGWSLDVPLRGLPLAAVDFIVLYLIAVAVGSLLMLQPGFRRQEAEADEFALDLTGDPAAFRGLIHTLAVVAGQRPSARITGSFGCTHPPPVDRMRAADDWAARQAMPDDVGFTGTSG